ncbi:type III-B CRISPR module-associated protein Cmr5 [Persephonella sp. KM09-Lau-8]|uniref:type III-B CRISPR module-associated protein Cmr5 n=1 Tax=Persephonella sp. KM09-Lau-8 TaxID=1158345 RepID=UPI00049616D5|nr:type III-B CRISPR module-associated protein Cmr5 [Persephonella sp. KM09-Lau-8]
MSNQTLEQKRANYAFRMIQTVIDKDYEKEFSSLISKLPTLILTNGLGNTLSFLFSKGKEYHLLTIAILTNWLFNESDLKVIKGKFQDEWFDNLEKLKDKENIANILNPIVLEANTEEYIFATEETLRLLNWLRRFSEAMLKKGDENA